LFAEEQRTHDWLAVRCARAKLPMMNGASREDGIGCQRGMIAEHETEIGSQEAWLDECRRL